MANTKIKRIRLNLDEEVNFSAFGIVSSEPDYKVSLLLNNLLGTSLRSAGQIENEVPEGKKVYYSRFNDLSRLPSAWFTVVSNRSDNYPLLKNLPNIDFIVLQFDELNPDGESLLFNALKNAEFISAAFIVEKTSIDKQLIEKIIPWY